MACFSACIYRFKPQQTEDRIAGGPHQFIVLGHHQIFQYRHADKQADILESPGHAAFTGNAKALAAFQKALFIVRDAA